MPSLSPSTPFNDAPVTSVTELFYHTATHHPDREALAFLDHKGNQRRSLTYGALREQSLQVATALQRYAEAGDTVLLAVGDEHDFVLAFGGALLAGLVPAPMPPLRNKRVATGLERCVQALKAHGGKLMLVAEGQEAWVRSHLDAHNLAHVQVLSFTALDYLKAEPAKIPEAAPEATAYLQYTSGSTSQPKAVMISHRNVIANVGCLEQQLCGDEPLRVAGWLPLHHDMGLVGHLLFTLYKGGFAALLSPSSFLARPGLWLEAVSRYQVNVAAAPTFALDLCVRHAKVSDQCDLSSWKWLCVGSETVSMPVLRAFVARFAALGMAENAIRPVYGLAEATLIAAGGKQGLTELIPLVESYRSGPNASRELLPFAAFDGIELSICDVSSGESLADGEVGEIWVEGCSVSAGYLGREPSSTPGKMPTGDLGYLRQGRLFVTGRKKDVVIVRGRNHAAEDLEALVVDTKSGYGAAVVAHPGANGDELWVFREAHRHLSLEQAQAVAAKISAAIVEGFDIKPDRVVLVAAGLLPRTANNKIARQACCQRYAQGELRVLYDLPATDWQVGSEPSDEDPVVIVGMACRFPGADSPEAFWHNLSEGVDCISEVPRERWNNEVFYDPAPATPGKLNTKWAGFIDRVSHFDSELFSISAIEAPEMDPQQRLLLETSWRLLEDCGCPVANVRGSDTGVFVGLSTNDYLLSKVKLSSGMETFNAYSGLGNANSVAANRLSYFYDFHGPSMTVDTACSSSLTAFHLGVQSIRNGECERAIVGGVNAILSPGPTITLSQFGMMAPDGRCKTFDASANGYVRAEGCGLVMLKRRSAALRDGDTILAEVAASVSGQDGASSGITHPNGDSQARLIARARRQAGIDGHEISYVEAHGTGTAAGDPVEVKSIVEQYGQRDDEPCFLGSVKANIGHLEAAAGIASVIKVLLMMRHQQVPPQILISQVNPALAIDNTRFQIAQERADWSCASERMAAISSFGFGGALAHVILKAPQSTPVEALPDGQPTIYPHPLVLSAPSEAALTDHVESVRDWLAQFPTLPYYQICRSFALGRSHLRYRTANLALNRSNVTDRLTAWLNSSRKPMPMREQVKCAWLFTGQGEHYLKMGQELYQRFPLFRESFDRCVAAVERADHPFTLTQLAFEIEDTRKWRDLYLQPILFATQYALARLMQACGVEPEVMVGHSLGEYAVACLAGCMTPEEAMRILYRRGQLTETLQPGNFMVVIFASREVVEPELNLDKAQIAAVNSPNKTVISGDGQEAERMRVLFQSRGIESYYLKTNTAFHSSATDPILEAFADSLKHIQFQPPKRRWISTVTGRLKTDAPNSAYWVRHMRDTVLFSPAMATLKGEPLEFIELGPGASSLAGARETLGCKDALYLRTLNPKKGERTESYFLLETLCRLYERGVEVNWEPVTTGVVRANQVPGLTFRQRTYWIKDITPEDFSAFSATSTLKDETADWHYGLQWQPGPSLPSLPVESKLMNWLIVGADDELTRSLIGKLKADNQSVFWLHYGEGRSRKADVHIEGERSRGEWSQALGRIFNLKSRSAAAPWRTVVNLSGMDVETLDLNRLNDTQANRFNLLLPMLQGLYDQGYVHPLWMVTVGAQAVDDEAQTDLASAPLWGFGKTLFLENPAWRGGMIDLGLDAEAQRAANQVIAKVVTPEFEHCIAVRGEQQYVQQLVRAPLKSQPAATLRDDGVYVITGGLGGLGLKVADWIVDKGGRDLILISRRSLPTVIDAEHPDAAVTEQVTKLQQRGARVHVESIDVRDSQALSELFSRLDAKGIAVRGVVHAAGENWFGKVLDLDRERFIETLKTKVSASYALHELTRERDLDCFMLFSSVSAFWGSVNLAHYTAANQFMDMLSLHRAQQGLPSLCIDWGPWDEVGMSAKPAEREVMAKLGLQLLAPEQALKAMEAAYVAKRPLSMITNNDWDTFQVFIDFCLQPSAFANVTKSREQTAVRTEDRIGAIKQASEAEAMDMINKAVRLELKSVTLLESADRIDEQQRFNFMGMDSLMALSFAAALENYFQFEVPSTLTYNYPTIKAVNEFIYQNLIGAAYEDSEGEPRDGEPAIQSWLRPLNSEVEPMLICLPFAGSGVTAYQPLAAELEGKVHLVGIQLPGREEMSHLSAVVEMETMVEQIIAQLTDIHRPCFIYGHSMGAAIASELAKRLERHSSLAIDGLIVSGCNPPEGKRAHPIHQLADEQLVDAVLDKYESPMHRSERKQAISRSIGLLRADLTLFETYQPTEERLHVPIASVYSAQDPLVDEASMRRWQRFTEGGFVFKKVEGGHRFVVDNASELAQALDAAILEITQHSTGGTDGTDDAMVQHAG